MNKQRDKALRSARHAMEAVRTGTPAETDIEECLAEPVEGGDPSCEHRWSWRSAVQCLVCMRCGAHTEASDEDA